MPADDPTPLPRRAADWLFQQGVSTVLLAALCYSAYRVAPRIEAAFERQQKAHADERQQDKTDFTAALKNQGEVFERTLDRLQPRAPVPQMNADAGPASPHTASPPALEPPIPE